MRKFIIISLFFFLSACAGTGTKNYSSINYEAPSDQAVLFIGRKNRYVASAALPKILLDGQEIAMLGIGEMERLNISAGSHKLQTKIGNILQLGTGGDSAAFVAEKGKAAWAEVDLRAVKAQYFRITPNYQGWGNQWGEVEFWEINN